VLPIGCAAPSPVTTTRRRPSTINNPPSGLLVLGCYRHGITTACCAFGGSSEFDVQRLLPRPLDQLDGVSRGRAEIVLEIRFGASLQRASTLSFGNDRAPTFSSIASCDMTMSEEAASYGVRPVSGLGRIMKKGDGPATACPADRSLWPYFDPTTFRYAGRTCPIPSSIYAHLHRFANPVRRPALRMSLRCVPCDGPAKPVPDRFDHRAHRRTASVASSCETACPTDFLSVRVISR